MSDQTDNLSPLFASLGLETDEARIYLLLLQSKARSALDLSRQLHITRTRVYRLLDKLEAKGMVNSRLGELGMLFGANDPEVIKLLIAEQEGKLNAIKQQSGELISKLATLAYSSQSDSEVKYYKGAEGLKQVTLNSLKAKNGLFIYEVNQDMSSFIDPDFSETIRTRFAENKVGVQQLTNLPQIKAYTNVREHIRDWNVRYVDPKKLRIQFETLIYNDIYALYSVDKNEMFCVEIRNLQLADMQKQIFRYVWESATPMKKIGEFGEARIV